MLRVSHLSRLSGCWTGRLHGRISSTCATEAASRALQGLHCDCKAVTLNASLVKPVQVGEMLDRLSAWPRFQHLRDISALKSALEAYAEEQGHPRQRMPTLADLVSTGREDLVRAIGSAGRSRTPALPGSQHRPRINAVDKSRGTAVAHQILIY